MVLEACMLCLDNSEWMRNGDYIPTRFDAQNETLNYIANAKIQANQESTTGFLTMAGHRIEVHVSLSRSVGAIMTAVQQVKVGGDSNILHGLKTAQLALKNRQNKNQRQRIIMFVGSPVMEPTKMLIKLGKNFKKNNVALDIVNFGDENTSNENTEKLEALINACNNSDNSHLVNIPPGPHMLSDLVLTSAIMMDTPGAGATASGGFGRTGGGAAGGAPAGSVDPNVDPELAMALRMSMEDERQRLERASGGDAAPGADATPVAAADAEAHMEEDDDDDDDDDDEALLQQAIAMSMAAEMDDDDEAEQATKTKEENPKEEEEETAAAEEDEDVSLMQDPDFLNSLLDSVPGVNRDEIDLDDILNQLTGDVEEEEKPKEGKPKE